MTAIRLEAELHDGIEQFIADRAEAPRGRLNYDDAVSVIIRDWLIGPGYIPPPGAPDAVTPPSTRRGPQGLKEKGLVELSGIEPLTSSLRTTRSPN